MVRPGVRHWQYNVIVTLTTGAIKYSVSDCVEEKGTTVNRKKPPVYVSADGACEAQLTSVKNPNYSST